MEFKTRKSQGVTIADLGGRLTAGGGDAEFRSRIERLVDGGVRSFLLNLGGLEAIDSSGIGEITNAGKAVERVGGSIKLFNVGSAIRRTEGMDTLLAAFETFDDEASAVASFQR